METKTCSVCFETHPIDFFSKNGNRLRADCKNCSRKKNVNHYENNKTNSYKRIELYDDSFSKIMLVENYTKNLKQGEAIKYYPSGKIQQINNYIDDQDMGGYWYSEDGKQTEKISGVYRDKNFGRKE